MCVCVFYDDHKREKGRQKNRRGLNTESVRSSRFPGSALKAFNTKRCSQVVGTVVKARGLVCHATSPFGDSETKFSRGGGSSTAAEDTYRETMTEDRNASRYKSREESDNMMEDELYSKRRIVLSFFSAAGLIVVGRLSALITGADKNIEPIFFGSVDGGASSPTYVVDIDKNGKETTLVEVPIKKELDQNKQNSVVDTDVLKVSVDPVGNEIFEDREGNLYFNFGDELGVLIVSAMSGDVYSSRYTKNVSLLHLLYVYFSYIFHCHSLLMSQLNLARYRYHLELTL